VDLRHPNGIADIPVPIEVVAILVIDLRINNATLSAKKGQVRLEDAAAKASGRWSGSLHRPDEILHQLLEVVGTAIGQFALGERSDPLLRVEFRCVRREVLDVQTRLLHAELA